MVSNQWSSSDLLLDTRQAMFSVSASGPTFGSEQLSVASERIAGVLRWYVTDLTAAEVPTGGVVCPEQSYLQVCDLSRIDFSGAGSVDTSVFFTPVETHSGLLGAPFPFEAS